MDNVSNKIDTAIQALLQDFEQIPNKYLTEDDVRIHLCSLLMSDFGNEERTQDGDFSIPLHSEVRWWGPDKRKDRTDIVIFDVSGLSVTENVVKNLFSFGEIPKKGYASSTPIAAIELKFRRVDGVGNAAFIKQVKADVNKLQELKLMMGDYSQNLVCRVVALDKKEQINNWNTEEPYENLCYQFSNRSKRA